MKTKLWYLFISLLLFTFTALCVAQTNGANYAAEKAAMNAGNELDAVVSSLCNSLVCVQIDEDGDFNIGTLDGRSLLYYYPSEPWSSDIRIRVDGYVYNLEDEHGTTCNGMATFINWSNNGTTITVNYSLLGYLAIQVTHTPVLFSATTGAILTRTVVTNNDNTSHYIGVLYEYDTTVEGDDAAELYLGPNHLSNETCFDAPFTYPYWDAIPYSGTLVGRGTFTGNQAVTPDHLAFGQWGDLYGTCWGRVCDNMPYGDSAVLYQWDEVSVAPGTTRNVATYYGVGEITVQPGVLQVSVSQPPLTCTPSGVQPNPFQLLVNLTNTGGSTCSNISVLMSNGVGPGGAATISAPNPQIISSITPGNNAAVSFTANLTANPLGGNVTFTVSATAVCDTNYLTFSVDVPPCEVGCPHVYPGDDCTQPYVIVEPSCCWSGTFDLCNYCDDYDLSPCTYEPSAAPDMVFEVTLHSPDPSDPPDLYVLVNPVGNWDPSLVVMTDCGDFMTCLCGEDANGPGWPEVCSFSNLGNGTYYIIVSGWMSQCGVFQICVNSDWPLPVELESFVGVEGNREVELTWTTASETNNDHFYLIRGLDNRNFTRISNDIPATNSPTGSTYSYLDRYLSNGTTYYYKLVDVDINGIPEVNEMVVTVTPSANAVIVPDDYALRQNYPNPFNPTTQISYDLREAGFVTLTVFDILGREVATLVNAQQSAASYTVEFDASDLSSGIYFYQLKVNDYTNLKKMVILK